MTLDQNLFATFLATLGRGPGRSRALTRDEAREAFGMVLSGLADAHQVGAFLMLLRYRGEDPDEITGLVEAARVDAGIDDMPLGVALDWPSYGAGRTRTAPWFLLSALALARSGVPILMHGSNTFSSGVPVSDVLAALGMPLATGLADAAKQLSETNFAYLPLRALSPRLDRLMDMRRLFGLRSPVNTVARLLNPGNATAGVDGVFHPPYIQVHLGVAERMHRKRLLVLKGGGGEAERSPVKPIAAHIWDNTHGRSEWLLPAWPMPGNDASGNTLSRENALEALIAVWFGRCRDPRLVATVRATIALALVSLGCCADPTQADRASAVIWEERGTTDR